jgi:hypothetical protein
MISRFSFLKSVGTLLGALWGAGQGIRPEGENGWHDTIRHKDFTPSCKENEERCPLGHCQKPIIRMFYTIQSSQGVAGACEVNICSSCGSVYVPRKEGKGP